MKGCKSRWGKKKHPLNVNWIDGIQPNFISNQHLFRILLFGAYLSESVRVPLPIVSKARQGLHVVCAAVSLRSTLIHLECLAYALDTDALAAEAAPLGSHLCLASEDAWIRGAVEIARHHRCMWRVSWRRLSEQPQCCFKL